MFDVSGYKGEIWKERFDGSLGYALQERMSAEEIISARLLYGLELSPYVASWLYRNVGLVGSEIFWALMAAPENEIVGGAYISYKKRGEDLREIALMRVLGGRFPGAAESDLAKASELLSLSGYIAGGKRDPPPAPPDMRGTPAKRAARPKFRVDGETDPFDYLEGEERE